MRRQISRAQMNDAMRAHVDYLPFGRKSFPRTNVIDP
jgi:hypothetical protein